MSAKLKIPVHHLRKLAKEKLLTIVPTDDEPEKMRAYLSRGQPLSVQQMIALLDDKSGKLMARLGTYQDKAQAQLDAIGDPSLDALPAEQSANYIYGCRMLDTHALPLAAEWLKRIIPAGGCSYHYVAIRMIWNCPEPRRKQSYFHLPRGMSNLAAYVGDAWRTKPAKGPVRFHRPTFDL